MISVFATKVATVLLRMQFCAVKTVDIPAEPLPVGSFEEASVGANGFV